MRITNLEWDEYRIEHIAGHGVEPYEVWEVCQDPLNMARREGRRRYRLYGQTGDGRYLFVVFGILQRQHIQARHSAGYDKW